MGASGQDLKHGPRHKRGPWLVAAMVALAGAGTFIALKPAGSGTGTNADGLAEGPRASQRTSPEERISQRTETPPAGSAMAELSRQVKLLPPTPEGAWWGPGLMAAFRSAMAEPSEQKRNEKLNQWLQTLDARDMPEVLDYLQLCWKSLSDGELSPEIAYHTSELAATLFVLWTRTDLTAAAEWATRQPDDSCSGYICHILDAWKDPAAAEAWLGGLTGEDARNVGWSTLAYRSMDGNPAEGLRLGMKMPAGDNRDSVIGRSGAEWVTVDPAAALEAGRALADPAMKEAFLSGAAVAWAEKDPLSAALLAVDELPEGRSQQNAVVSIVQRWAQQDPAKAAEWVEAFPDGELKKAAVENLVMQWKQRDEARATAWAAKMK